MPWTKIGRGYRSSSYTAIFAFCKKCFRKNMLLLSKQLFTNLEQNDIILMKLENLRCLGIFLMENHLKIMRERNEQVGGHKG